MNESNSADQSRGGRSEAPGPNVPPVVRPPHAGTHPRADIQGAPCPRCGHTGHSTGPWPWYLGTIGAMIVQAVVCNNCGHHFDLKKPDADLAKRKVRLALILNGIGAIGILLCFTCLGLVIMQSL